MLYRWVKLSLLSTAACLVAVNVHAATTSSATIRLNLAEQQNITLGSTTIDFPPTLTASDLITGGQETTPVSFVAWTTNPEPTQGLQVDIASSSYELVNQTNNTYRIPIQLVFTPCGAGATPITAQSGDTSITIPKENIPETTCTPASGGQQGTFKVILLPYSGGGNPGIGDYEATVQLDLSST